MIKKVVAIVGRANVGKSTLFNRLLMERKSIVEDSPGVTRDRIYGVVEWLNQKFRIIDTGGFGLGLDNFQKEINIQVEIAIEEADIIVFVTSAKEGLLDEDRYIAKLLHKSGKKVILMVNKIDDGQNTYEVYPFFSLGFEAHALSAAHGIGVGDLLELIAKTEVDKRYKEYQNAIQFAIIGRPNVGKSSLVNAILNEQRVIVSDIEGTTRDAIDSHFKVDGQDYVVVDTAGIRRKGKIQEDIEKYSLLRAMSAMERSDVVLVVLDASRKISEQDKHIAGYAHESGKAIVIVVNKWDLVEKDQHTMDQFKKTIRSELKFITYAPIVFLSANTKEKLHQLIPQINEVYNYSQLRISTSLINEVVLDAQAFAPPKPVNGQKGKIFYASQVAIAPITIVLFVNNKELIHFSYQRYIENKLREAFLFTGNNIITLLRERDK